MEDHDKAVELKGSTSALKEEKTHLPAVAVETKVDQKFFKRCFICETRFKLFQWRHKCNKCRSVVCGRCLPERICVSCIRIRVLNQELSNEKKKADKRMMEIHKALLFEARDRGTAETFLGPMMNTYGSNLKSFIPDIHRSLIKAAQYLVQATGTGDRHKYILGMGSSAAITLENVEYFKALWNENHYWIPKACEPRNVWDDSSTQDFCEQYRNNKFVEFADFFLPRVDELVRPDYKPTGRDVMKWRAQATSLVQLEFNTGDAGEFHIWDASRMATERRKWLPCFQYATSVMFVFALPDYAMMGETPDTNRLVEALAFFEEICNSSWCGPYVILCLTGHDLFKKNLKYDPLSVCPTFRDYTGPQTFDSAINAINEEFANKAGARNKKMYTVASDFDSQIFQRLFRDIVVSMKLHTAGVL